MIEALDYLRLFGGFVYLVLGGDLLVRGAIGLANKTSISPLLIGLTVVAVGTSAPELMVSVYAALTGFPGVAVGNVVGSNIANVLLVVGVPALIHPVLSRDAALKPQAWFMLGVSVLFAGLCLNGTLGWVEGLIFLAILVTSGVLTFSGKAQLPGADLEDAEEQLQRGWGLPVRPHMIAVFVLLGAVLLPLGADLTVDGAVNIAGRFGVEEAVIGATLVALGTSLPELSTTVIAAFYKSSDVALGNVIGSNVLNILAILGITALVADLPVPEQFLRFDLWVMLACAVLVTLYVVTNRAFGRTSGALLLAGYFGYYWAVL